MKRLPNLLKKFLIYSFILYLLTSILLIFFIDEHIKDDRIYWDEQMTKHMSPIKIMQINKISSIRYFAYYLPFSICFTILYKYYTIIMEKL